MASRTKKDELDYETGAEDAVEAEKARVREIARASGNTYVGDNGELISWADRPGSPVYSGGVWGSSGGSARESYGADVYSALGDIENDTNNWRYDVYADPEYDKLVHSLQLGADNTSGQLAARTGGLASSYAATAAQQQFDSGLNAGIQALKNDAYARRQAELENKYNLLSALMGIENGEYSRHRNTVSDNQWALSRQDQNSQYQQQLRREEYSRLKQLADTMAQTGDFSGYQALGYSDRQIASLQSQWIYDNPDEAYYHGNITADAYYKITGKYPKF